MLFWSNLSTRFGTLALAVNQHGMLVEILLPNRHHVSPQTDQPSQTAAHAMRAARRQLDEYFLGKRRDFELPLLAAGSPFERLVWDRLLRVPYGVTTSYGAIASELGLPNGARAVGRANAANPLPIVIPCHRVIGSDGALTGYGGGLGLKRSLLALEGAIGAPEPSLFELRR